MSRRDAPSRGDRHRGASRVGMTLGVATRRRRVAAPPVLRDNQVRCPVCRNGATTTPYGYLRRHRDLFGNDCFNKAAVK